MEVERHQHAMLFEDETTRSFAGADTEDSSTRRSVYSFGQVRHGDTPPSSFRRCLLPGGGCLCGWGFASVVLVAAAAHSVRGCGQNRNWKFKHPAVIDRCFFRVYMAVVRGGAVVSDFFFRHLRSYAYRRVAGLWLFAGLGFRGCIPNGGRGATCTWLWAESQS